jgi:hypothetical protein
LRTAATVVSRAYLPPGWAKFWWLADRIQYVNQRKLQKKATPDSFRKEFTPLPILLFQKMRG